MVMGWRGAFRASKRLTGAALALVLTAAPIAHAQEAQDVSSAERSAAANALALNIGDRLEERCRVDGSPTIVSPGDEAPYLLLIADATDGADITVIGSALQTLTQDQGLCAAARAAIVSALQSSQLAQATGDEPTGGIGGTPTSPFAAGGGGPPGGGGGSGYIS